MPPKVDPTEVRFSILVIIEFTSKYLEGSQALLQLLPPNWVLLVS